MFICECNLGCGKPLAPEDYRELAINLLYKDTVTAFPAFIMLKDCKGTYERIIAEHGEAKLVKP